MAGASASCAIKQRSFQSGARSLASGRTSTYYFNMKRRCRCGGRISSRRSFRRPAGTRRPDGGLMGAVPYCVSRCGREPRGRKPINAFFVQAGEGARHQS